jgi:TFIIF-interacting CTD phosphatase-like protein
MKYFRNLFYNKNSNTKKFTKIKLNDDIGNESKIFSTDNSFSESGELSQSMSKLINKLEINNLIKKVDNNYTNFSSNKSLLRTIVDESPLQEDIFKHIIRRANSKIPDIDHYKKNKLTLFLPFDDILLYNFIPDDNFGMSEIPKHKDFDFRLELPEYKTFAYVFLRENFNEFMEFINENFEPILYSTGEKNYVDKLLNIIDPGNIFGIKLYQQDCHLYKDTSQNHLEYLKDINMFTNRSLKKKIILDNSPFNYLLSPDNGIPNFNYIYLKIDYRIFTSQNNFYIWKLFQQGKI